MIISNDHFDPCRETILNQPENLTYSRARGNI